MDAGLIGLEGILMYAAVILNPHQYLAVSMLSAKRLMRLDAAKCSEL